MKKLFGLCFLFATLQAGASICTVEVPAGLNEDTLSSLHDKGYAPISYRGLPPHRAEFTLETSLSSEHLTFFRCDPRMESMNDTTRVLLRKNSRPGFLIRVKEIEETDYRCGKIDRQNAKKTELRLLKKISRKIPSCV